jgi:glycosyltransferase involved in cell wall biosynthesis
LGLATLSTATIVVACRNERAHIAQLLNGLVQLDRTGLALDAIIADGESTDGTRAILDEFGTAHPWCRVIDNPERIVSTGLNRAIRLTQTEYIVRMDAHTTYEPGYVVRCIAILNETGAANAGGPQRSRATGYWQRAIHAGFHSAFASGGARFRSDDYSGPVDTVPYGCWRRAFLLDLGLFDEALVRNQDDELNLRTRLRGGIIWQDASIVSCYSPRTSLGGLWSQYQQFGFFRIAVLRKHPGHGSVRQFIPAAAAVTALVLALMIAAEIERRAAFVTASSLAIVYVFLSLWTSLRAASREGWDLLPALPVTFAVYQAAYALGFCQGLVYWLLRDPKRRRQRA